MKWNHFEKEYLSKIFDEKDNVIDIGGTLRLKDNNDRGESGKWEYLKGKKAKYLILDVVDTYNPDMVGDVQDLKIEDNSIDSYVCMSVLEHVENPIISAKELYRTLKPGGYLYIYVPFLYYYHAEKGYYGDYWRFTEDSLRFMFKDFTEFKIEPVRGALGTLINLTPLASFLPSQRSRIDKIGYFLDKLFKKVKSKQVSGYNVFLVK